MAIGFPLTRSRLQALDECARRFWLAWIHRVPWPAAAEATSAEEALARGREFHRLMERHFLGLTVEPVAPSLRALWQAWQKDPLPLPSGSALPEVTLSIPEGDERLLARFDLLAIPTDPQAATLIADWKTAGRPRTRRELAADIQTRLYPYILVEGGTAIAGRGLSPDYVELVYWQAAAPADPVRFRYSAAEHRANGVEIRALIARAEALREKEMPAVIDDLSICARCPYRTYCGQPVPAVTPDPEPDPLENDSAGEEAILEDLG
jgi:hypothetical protein